MSDSAEPLGKITKFVANMGNHPKAARFAIQAIAISLLPNERIRVCCHVPIVNRTTVDILHNPATNTARYAGLMKCGLGWICPLCQMRLAEKRREQLNLALDHSRGRYEVFMSTYTVRHGRMDRLKPLLENMIAAYRYMRQQYSWRVTKQEYAIVGEIRATEITYSYDAGFHPHFHVLVFVDSETVKGQNDYYAGILENQLYEHWIAALRQFGLSAERSVGMKVQKGDQASRYITKYAHWSLGHEMTGQGRKKPKQGGESIWDILLRHWAGDPSAAALFREYHEATKGKSSLQWATSLRELLAVEDTDEKALCDELEPSERVLMRLTLADWRLVVQAGKIGVLLDVASAGDYEKVANWLIDLSHGFMIN